LRVSAGSLPANRYNCGVKAHKIILIAVAALALGCGGDRNLQSQEAVRQGVIDHLSKRTDLNVNSMSVDVMSVSFREDEADATVAIRLKGGGPDQTMQMRYTLERQGNQWIVKGRSEAGDGHAGAEPGMVSPHGGAGDLPPGHPPTGQQPAPNPAQ
jgi:hypothetical protein